MSAWAIEQHRGHSTHILVVIGYSDGFKYAHTGFVYSPKQAALGYPKLEHFHHVPPNSDFVGVATTVGMQVGGVIAERWTLHLVQHQASERPIRPPSQQTGALWKRYPIFRPSAGSIR